jgi:hypothetical protein
VSESGGEISFRLRTRRDHVHSKLWLVVPVRIADSEDLMMVANSIASRSVLTPPAFSKLRKAGLTGADILDFPSGRVSCLLKDMRIAEHAVPDLLVRVRDVDEFLIADDEYVVDGYFGLDYLLGAFSSFAIETATLRVTLGLKPRPRET